MTLLRFYRVWVRASHDYPIAQTTTLILTLNLNHIALPL